MVSGPATPITARCRLDAWAVALLSLALAGAIARAGEAPEESNFLVASWHTEHGLPDGNITALAQTPDGYLWIGTFKGLVRFDGVRFTPMAPVLDEVGLGERIAALLTDHRGRLWIADEAGALARLDNGRIEPVGPQPTTNASELVGSQKPGIPPIHSTHSRLLHSVSLAEAPDGDVWMQTGRSSIWRVTAEGSLSQTPANELPSGPLHALVGDAVGQPWLLAGDRLYRWANDRWTRASDIPFPGDARPVLAPARQGGLWIAAARGSWESGGGRVFRVSERQMARNLDPTPWATNSPRSTITAMLEDQRGRIWLGTQWGGLLYEDGSGHWQRAQTEGPLALCRVNTLFEGHHDALWVGTLGDGLHRLTTPPIKTLHLPEPAKEHLLNTVCAAPDGSVWVGTDGAGAFRYDEGRFTHVGATEGLAGEVVLSILADRQSNVWCSTSAGLFRSAGSQFERVTAMPITRSVALLEDRTEQIWISTPRGPVCLHPDVAEDRAGNKIDDSVLHPFTARRDEFEVRSMTEDPSGNLWVGTVGNGLVCLRSNRVERYRAAEGLSNPDARSVWCDAEGGVWVGTLGGGLFHRANGRFHAITTADGLPDDTINSITEDGEGTLWMTSYNGLFGCARSQLSRYERGRTPALVCRWFSVADGLDYRACSGAGQPVASRSADGRLWFVNQRSLAVFDPHQISVADKMADILLEEINVDGTPISRPLEGPLRLTSRMRRLEVHYTCPNLIAPESLRFRYQLQRFDKDWTEAGSRRVAYYGKLPPGRYEFEVMVGAAGGNWRRWTRGLQLEVVPLFYERAWVQTVGGVGLLATAATISWAVARGRLRRRLVALEQQRALEQERARIARDMHDEVGARLTQISLLSTLALSSAEDVAEVRTQNTKISGVARDLTRSLDEIVWAVRPQNDNLESLVEYLGQAARDLCAGSNVRCWFSAPADVPALELSANLRHNVLLACCESVNNVLKHSGASEVRVRLQFHDGELMIEVADNGRGFDLAKGEAKRSGLLHMRQRMAEIGGNCEINPAEVGGTKVKFILPLDARKGVGCGLRG